LEFWAGFEPSPPLGTPLPVLRLSDLGRLQLVTSVLGTVNNKSFHETQLVYLIRVATCFDPIGSSSGLHYEPVNYKVAYILGTPNSVYK